MCVKKKGKGSDSKRLKIIKIKGKKALHNYEKKKNQGKILGLLMSASKFQVQFEKYTCHPCNNKAQQTSV